MSDGLLSRQVAFALLHQILLKKNPMDQVLPRHDGFNKLEQRDRNFTRMLVSTCLRHKGSFDKIILSFQSKKEPLTPKELPLILYIGLAQILYMDVPDHAAVDMTVRLCEAEGMTPQKGFINALLRRALREKEQLKISVADSIPDWLWQAWEREYGAEIARDIAKASLTEAPLDITMKDPSDNLQIGERLPTGSIRLEAHTVTEIEGFSDGKWWVQDASSALPVALLGDIKGKTVIDLCAAPGGKTMQLAAAGAHVMAVDRSEKRLKRLKENLDRTKLSKQVDIIVADGSSWQPPHTVDIVLLDAPCSATGTIRRHPDLMHLKTQKDITQLVVLQKKLLANAERMVASDGVLLYCTCSLQKDEGENQVDTFLKEYQNFERLQIRPDQVGQHLEFINNKGDLRVLPFHQQEKGGMDGFFSSKLLKKPLK